MGIETERRRHDRVAVAFPVHLERLGNRGLAATGSTVDLSEGGAKVEVDGGGFAVGDVVRLTIDGGDGLLISHQGLVVGAAPGGPLNVAFKTLDDRAMGDLRRLLDLA